jgi:hypothetical protein
MTEFNFVEFKKELQDNITKVLDKNKYLFVVDVDKDQLWEAYLNSFPANVNQIYRKRREMDCGACKQFIRAFGNVVYINEYLEVVSIFEWETSNEVHQAILNSLSAFVTSYDIKDVFFTDTLKIGQNHNLETLEDGTIQKWEHLYCELPERFKASRGKSVATLQSEFRSNHDVFKNSLEEISIDSVETVLELVTGTKTTVYRGEEWKANLEKFLIYLKEWTNTHDDYLESWYWLKSIEAGSIIVRMKNHSIGVLLLDITKGKDLTKALKSYHKNIVAPEKYQRNDEIYTKKMLDDSRAKIEELGYLNSLPRRFANIEDISVNDILFVDRDNSAKLKDSVFDEMSQEIATDPKKFNNCEEIPIDSFVDEILPNSDKIELLVENRQVGNFVSLIAPQDKEALSMFKWNNPFSWSYNGNVTDSMKEQVTSLGGKVKGVLRFTIMWNDDRENNPDNNDLDAWCIEPNGHKIYYSDMRSYKTGGNLDVDIIQPMQDDRVAGKPAIENIIYPFLRGMDNGKYLFCVHVYSYRNGTSGFKAEIEFNGEMHEFEFNGKLSQDDVVKVAEVTLKDGEFTIGKLLDGETSTKSKDIWNIKTNTFVPVKTVMMSPNFWNDDGIGNKHLFLMLEDCINPETPNGFFNEFLKKDLNVHKKFFAALGSKMKVEPNDNQLSGLGFSSTLSNSFIARVTGKTERILKVTI